MAANVSADDLRRIAKTHCGDDDEGEHTMTAAGVVLLAAGMHDITAPSELVHLTGYGRSFISAVIFNLQNNHLWIDGRYDASSWLTLEGIIKSGEFRDHIRAACGELWLPAGNSELGVNTCELFWADESRRSARDAQSGEGSVTGTQSAAQPDLSIPPLGQSERNSAHRSSQIDWTNLRCDNCTNMASHVCVDDAWPDDAPVIHVSYCDDCFFVNMSGTQWLHWEDSDP
jgi:hypothetical protein